MWYLNCSHKVFYEVDINLKYKPDNCVYFRRKFWMLPNTLIIVTQEKKKSVPVDDKFLSYRGNIYLQQKYLKSL